MENLKKGIAGKYFTCTQRHLIVDKYWPRDMIYINIYSVLIITIFLFSKGVSYFPSIYFLVMINGNEIIIA